MASEVAHELDEQSWLYRPSFPDEWERIPLFSMARWVNGLAFRDFQFSDTGMPIIKIAEIKGGITGQTKFTNQTFAESVFVKSGDMLFSWSGQPETSIDVFWWRGRDGWLNQHIFKVTPIEELDPVFFFYVLRYLKPNFIGIARNKQTTGLGHVTRRDIENIEAAFPPLAEQKAIAAVLGALDDKIELNLRMNATLEATARALFQSWFVDFDPVRAKLDGRKPVCLDKVAAALFPEHLEDSSLGHIPQGWKACALAELIEVVKGRSYRSEELAESKTALVTLKSFLRGGGYRIDGLKPFTGEYKPNQRVRPGDLVVAFTDVTQAADVIGKPALVRSDERFETLVASLDVGIVRPKSKHVSIPFLYCLFLTAEFQAHTYSHATGTTVLHLGSAAIPSFVSVVPPVDVAEKFAERADPIFRLIDENAKQSRTLATLRDKLLPKLLSGELSVHGASND